MIPATVERVTSFGNWRRLARRHLLHSTPPDRLIWQPAEDTQSFLFDDGTCTSDFPPDGTVLLPRDFIDQAKTAARHRDGTRWSLLYRIAWRITNENRNLLRIETDEDVRALALMRKAVQNDIYKMRAFVRFRRVPHDGAGQFVAWYRPHHRTLDANERFFVDRFGGMRWAILTPELSMVWDQHRISYGPGTLRSEAPAEDEYEELWRTYYKSTYNPARLNLDAMRAQLPVGRWEDLPESRTIPELVRISRGTTESLIRSHGSAASAFIPLTDNLVVLRDAVNRCQACELCARATQPVFGEGPSRAGVLLVGEQPGDEEDLAGRPFVGPAGQVLAAAMIDAELSRESVYITNAVKAFRFEERGKRRIHQTPRPVHVATCRPWLEAEVAAVQPERIVCLGATAAQSVLGRAVQIRAERARPLAEQRWGAGVIVTYHPSAVLRAPDSAVKQEMMNALIQDLRLSARQDCAPSSFVM